MTRHAEHAVGEAHLRDDARAVRARDELEQRAGAERAQRAVRQLEWQQHAASERACAAVHHEECAVCASHASSQSAVAATSFTPCALASDITCTSPSNTCSSPSTRRHSVSRASAQAASDAYLRGAARTA